MKAAVYSRTYLEPTNRTRKSQLWCQYDGRHAGRKHALTSFVIWRTSCRINPIFSAVNIGRRFGPEIGYRENRPRVPFGRRNWIDRWTQIAIAKWNCGGMKNGFNIGALMENQLDTENNIFLLSIGRLSLLFLSWAWESEEEAKNNCVQTFTVNHPFKIICNIL